MAGALIMFVNTPKVDSQAWIGQAGEGEELDRKRNQMMRVGIGLLVIGFLLQILALTVDHFKL